MALWGKTDTLASAPKYIARKAYFIASAVNLTENTIDLREPVSSTCFAVGDGVVYNNGGGASATGLTSGSTYYVASSGTSGLIKLSDTEAHAKAGTNIIDITGQGNNAQYLQRNTEGNESIAEGNGDHIYNGRDLYFIDANEAQQPENRARGLKVPGWSNYRSYTDANGNVRNKSEVLVAMGAYSGATGFGTYQAQTGDNNADDAAAVDGTITIGTQPLSQSKVAGSGAGNKGVFTVVATLAGVGTLAYQWQVAESATPLVFANVSRGTGGTTATYTTGNTQVAASGSVDSNGDKYRCIVSATGAAVTSVTSVVATLTVTAS
jgi:hypothetical protein